MNTGSDIRIKKARSKKVLESIEALYEAIDIRDTINGHYKHYRELSNIACLSVDTSPQDIKRSVDALYYLGGGWPTQNSKGRMEAALDNVAGMFKVLDFIGSGQLVQEHLANLGIQISIAEESKLKDSELTDNDKKFLISQFKSEYFELKDFKTRKELVTAIMLDLQETQGTICKLADRIKLELRPQISDKLGIEDEEYDRLADIARCMKKGTPKAKVTASNKKSQVESSISGFNIGVTSL